MGQQLAIIVLVDVAAAAETGTLVGSTYLFDNMRLQGSEGEGTGELVTAINGTHWVDRTQADEQVLNWLPYSLGVIPPTVPRNYHSHQGRAVERETLAAVRSLATRPPAEASGSEEIANVAAGLGAPARDRRQRRSADVALDITGNPAAAPSDGAPVAHDPPPLQITNIFGEAVDKNIIFPAQYGSPDLVTDGWYWSATVDSSQPGVYGYTMEFELHHQVQDADGWIWEPLRLTFPSRLRISNTPKVNAFTGAGISLLPIPATYSHVPGPDADRSHTTAAP
jgi:hypothetical protein